MLYDLKELLAAQALLCLRYGSLKNAVKQGAFAPKAPKAEAPPMDVEPVAGPSGVSRQNKRNHIKDRSRTISSDEIEGQVEELPNGGIPIGSGRTVVPAERYGKLRLKNYKFAIRSFMDALFTRSVLATSSLSGRPSPAFAHLPAKPRLNPVIIKDIVEEVSQRYGVTVDMISHVMTTKCADEAKISKNKKKSTKSERRKSSEDSEDM